MVLTVPTVAIMTGNQRVARSASRETPTKPEYGCNSREVGLRFSRAAGLLLGLYGCGGRRLRNWAFQMAGRLEGGQFFSGTAREILRRYYGVSIGAYSYGACMIPGKFPSGVTVGRYCSIAKNVRVFLRNHPLGRLSTHPFFYNKGAGFVAADTVENSTLQIGHDAWIGAGVMITPGCSRIGIGAAVGCGAVVTRDVDDFAVFAGNPAKLLRYRFPEELRQVILQSRWWDKRIEDLAEMLESMIRPLGPQPWHHPLLRPRWTSNG